MKTQAAGAAAERLAERFLKKHGMKLLARNYRTRAGEIDLVMREADTLVFVEVRLRNNSAYGSGAESVTVHKQAKIVRAAQHFLQSHDTLAWESCRFDVISVSGNTCVDWIPGAFTLD